MTQRSARQANRTDVCNQFPAACRVLSNHPGKYYPLSAQNIISLPASSIIQISPAGLPNTAGMLYRLIRKAGAKGDCYELRSSTTSFLLVDTSHEFLSEGDRPWPRAKAVAEQVTLLGHLRAILKVARDKSLKL